MADGGETVRPRYRAFISYSHRDAAFGRRLHGRLERYALPRRLVGRPGRLGPVPARLSPIFRDREELSAAGDLSAEVRAALAESAVLVVVCSPSAAASVWVGREIETFRALHPDRPVLVALAAGEPDEAFHPALTAGGGEPLAADFRREGDGERLALLKLAAGIAGVGLDELVQRDAQRRVARVTAVTAVSLAAMLAMGVMTAIALDARAEAERQRAEAEGLVGFMMTELRDRLKGVGRFDIMGSVNQRALTYYAGQEYLRPAQLEQQAAIHHAIGEDLMEKGDLSGALAEFLLARQTTAALLAEAPDDPNRIYGQAQSEAWVAQVALQQRRFHDARAGFLVYRRLAGHLVALQPGNATYWREVGYAEGSLGVVEGRGFRDLKAALRRGQAALSAMKVAAKVRPDDVEITNDIINRLAWLADAWLANDNEAKAFELRLEEERLLNALMARDPKNADLKETWVVTQRALAQIEMRRGNRAKARQRVSAAMVVANELVSFEPSNQTWVHTRADLQSTKISMNGGD